MSSASSASSLARFLHAFLWALRCAVWQSRPQYLTLLHAVHVLRASDCFPQEAQEAMALLINEAVQGRVCTVKAAQTHKATAPTSRPNGTILQKKNGDEAIGTNESCVWSRYRYPKSQHNNRPRRHDRGVCCDRCALLAYTRL